MSLSFFDLTNISREEISLSEKAKAYRMIHDLEKHQGKAGADTAEKIGEANNDSKRQVQRYIRLSYSLFGVGIQRTQQSF